MCAIFFTNLRDMVKSIVACHKHYGEALFIFSLLQVCGIVSLQPRHNGDSVAVCIAAHVYYNTSHHAHAQLRNNRAVLKFKWHKSLMRLSPDPFRFLRVGSGNARLC